MKATPSDQRAVLALQQIDLGLARVRRGAARAGAAQAVAEAEAAVTGLRRQLVTLRTEGQDLQRAIQRSETEIERVRARLTRDREMADAGASARVQRELEHELGSITRRLGELEDTELDMLGRAEDIAGQVSALESRETELAEAVTLARSESQAGATRAGEEERDLLEQREQAAAAVPPDLMAYYEKLRTRMTVAVATLSDSQCGGCRLQLPPGEVAELLAQPPDDIVHCEECGCMLVRA